MMQLHLDIFVLDKVPTKASAVIILYILIGYCSAGACRPNGCAHKK